MTDKSDSKLLNYRLAVTPPGNRKALMRELTDREKEFVRDLRGVHNGLGTWANAMLIKGATVAEIKVRIMEIAKEVRKL